MYRRIAIYIICYILLQLAIDGRELILETNKPIIRYRKWSIKSLKKYIALNQSYCRLQHLDSFEIDLTNNSNYIYYVDKVNNFMKREVKDYFKKTKVLFYISSIQLSRSNQFGVIQYPSNVFFELKLV